MMNLGVRVVWGHVDLCDVIFVDLVSGRLDVPRTDPRTWVPDESSQDLSNDSTRSDETVPLLRRNGPHEEPLDSKI